MILLLLTGDFFKLISVKQSCLLCPGQNVLISLLLALFRASKYSTKTCCSLFLKRDLIFPASMAFRVFCV